MIHINLKTYLLNLHCHCLMFTGLTVVVRRIFNEDFPFFHKLVFGDFGWLPSFECEDISFFLLLKEKLILSNLTD